MSHPCGILNSIMNRKIYKFETYTQWPDELNAAANHFNREFGKYPIIMLANQETCQKLDMVSSQPDKPTLDHDGHPPGNGEFVTLSAFVGDGYEIDLCMDESIASKSFMLVYDNDPDGGNEEDAEVEEDGLLDERKVG